MQNITIVPVNQTVQDFLSMDPGSYKRYKFYQDISDRTFTEANLLIKDDQNTVHYSYTSYKLKRSKDGYYKQVTKRQGFTLDEKGKLKIWFKGNVHTLPVLSVVLKHLNKEWFPDQFSTILTKGLLEKVLNGKITNPTDYAKAYLKAVRVPSCSPKLFLEAVMKYSFSGSQLYRAAQVAKDVNHYIEDFISKSKREFISGYVHITDLERQAMILDEKIDYKWSVKRMEEQHSLWTSKIMEMELDHIEDVSLDVLQPYHALMPSGFTLLDTQKKVFAEGKLMSHCVYTNYWREINSGRYLAIHVDMFNESATLGLNVHRDVIRFNQMYGKYNRPVSQKLIDYVQEWLKDVNMQYRNMDLKLQPEYETLDF